MRGRVSPEVKALLELSDDRNGYTARMRGGKVGSGSGQ
jgi:hypothetical protein